MRVSWLTRHKWPLIAAGGVVLAVLALAAAAYGYASSESGTIAHGVRIGSVNVGGLNAAAARAKLHRIFRSLERPIVLRYRGDRFVLTPRQAGLRVNTDALVNQALRQSRSGWFVSRAWRELSGGKVKLRLQPQYTYWRGPINSLIRRVQRRVGRGPQNARLVAGPASVVVYHGHPGRAVMDSRLRSFVAHALVSRHARRTIVVPTRIVQPKVTVAVLRKQTPSFITIDRAAFTLRVYQNLKFVRSYPIAVGQAGLETPAGLYHIQDKQVNPSWHVPNSAWAGSLAGQVIPPGPDDPIKARWMGIFNGAGIHGTDETWSIGHAVSHGCVRMLIPDAIDLYDRVQVGTPVYIGD
jgi:lipoprotein-anchoring transpeptidase ErfK/SrfK